MYLAAVFSNGRVATGRHHGEAFSKLSCEDQDADLISGHVNSDGTFTTEMDHLDKELIIVRHAESMWNAHLSESLDSSLTIKGVSQAQAVAKYIGRNIDCRGLVGFTSPFDRCLLTSMPIRRHSGVKFFVREEISEIANEFPECGVQVSCKKDTYLDIEWNNYSDTTFFKEPPSNFIGRLNSFFQSLPSRSLIVTHGSVVQTLIEIALGVKVQSIPAWDNSIKNASVTHIKDGTVVCLAKNVA